MYIGSTDVRGLHHLVWEVVDNSIDEAMAGFADHIEVTICWPTGRFAVADNGRGVPVGRHETGKDALEVVHTVLHAGGKFGGGGYKVSGGLHGVGVSVVNALSDGCASSRRATAASGRQEYARGKPDRPRCARSGRRATARGRRPSSWPTRGLRDHWSSAASRRSPSASASRPTSTRASGSRLVRRARADRERSFYFEGGLVCFVRHLNKNKEVLNDRPIYVERQGRLDRRSRSPCSTTTATPRTSSPSPTTSTRSTAAPTSPASARR